MRRVVSVTQLRCERCNVDAQFEEVDKIDWTDVRLLDYGGTELVHGDLCVSCKEAFMKWWRAGGATVEVVVPDREDWRLKQMLQLARQAQQEMFKKGGAP